MVTASQPPGAPAHSAHQPWYGRAPGWLPGRRHRVPDAIDIAIAAVSFAAFTLPVALGPPRGQGSPLTVAALGALAVAPLVVRRRWPFLALASVAAVDCFASLVGVLFTPFVSNAGPAMAIAVLTVADRNPRRASLLGCGAATFATAAAGLIGYQLYPEQDQNLVQLALAAPAWLLGDTMRTRRGYRHRLAIEGRRQAAERERRIRAEERLRVSRDVHDVMSHTLSMIAVRSGVARLLLHDQPGEAKDALAVIETASRSALDELRHVLKHTRQAEPRELRTEPALADLGTLVETLRHDGFELSYRSTGHARCYPPVLETSVYRIVQEALTNVVKHSAATHAWVDVRHGFQELVVSVVDDGQAHQHSGGGSGLGLIGMRERAELFDGTLTAGPRPEGGFSVIARFPTDGYVDTR